MATFVKLKIEGMRCTNCAAGLEKKLKDMFDCSVNFASQTAFVRSKNGNAIDLEFLNQQISDIGYKASPLNLRKLAVQTEKPQTAKFVVALIGLALFIANMTPLLFSSSMHLLSIPVQATISTILLFYCGTKFWVSAYHSLRNKMANMDVLVIGGSFIAWIYSFVAWKIGLEVYFEATGMIISLVMVGKLIEEKAKKQANKEIFNIASTLPSKARIQKRDENGKLVVQEIDAEALMINDVVLLKQGDRVPIDGVITDGEVLLDEAFFTGEAIPVLRKKGDKALAGMVVNEGNASLLVEKIETELENIIQTVFNAQGDKIAIQKTADKISSIFVPSILTISVLTFLGTWYFLGDWQIALINAISVIVVACPCALGLATPAAIMVGIGFGAKNGLLFRKGNALELASKITHIAFDKTGTLTQGNFSLKSIVSFNDLEHYKVDSEFNFDDFAKEQLHIAASLEAHVNHPFAKAILNVHKESVESVEEFESILGSGICGKLSSGSYKFGAAEWFDLDQKSLKIIDSLRDRGLSILVLGVKEAEITRPSSVFIFSDVIKPSAYMVVEKLKNIGVKPLIISGDSQRNVSDLASKLGIEKYYAAVTPAGKLDLISNLKKEGVVGMVGDGINDAPALATSDVSFAMASGADISVSAADVTVISGELDRIYLAINISRSTLRNIKQNLFLAFVYNSIAVLLAVFGILTPVIASIAMSFSSISVVLNALRLKIKLPKFMAEISQK